MKMKRKNRLWLGQASLIAQWVKNPPANAGSLGLILGWGRSPGRGKWQPTPVLLPEKNPKDRGTQRATV